MQNKLNVSQHRLAPAIAENVSVEVLCMYYSCKYSFKSLVADGYFLYL